MSLYLLDTNTVSHFLNVQSPRHNPVIRRIGALADSETVMVSILAIYEYSYGIENAPDEIKKRQLQRRLLRQSYPYSPGRGRNATPKSCKTGPASPDNISPFWYGEQV